MLNLEYLREFEMQVRLEEAREEGREEGRKMAIAYLMKSKGYSVAEISDISGLSQEVIESL